MSRDRGSADGRNDDPRSQLGKRERQIMDIVYRRTRASVADVLSELPDPPSYSSVRAMLRYLEDKGHLRHVEEGAKYVYLPTTQLKDVRKSALGHVVSTFFGGSVSSVVATLLESGELSSEEHARLAQLLDEAAQKDRRE